MVCLSVFFKIKTPAQKAYTIKNLSEKYHIEIDLLKISVRNCAKCVLSIVQNTDSSTVKNGIAFMVPVMVSSIVPYRGMQPFI